MNTLTHDGYIAEIDLDEESGLLSGVVLNTRATLRFAGRTVEELKAAFAETIEDYREWCTAEGNRAGEILFGRTFAPGLPGPAPPLRQQGGAGG